MPQYLLSVWHDDAVRRHRLQLARGAAPRSPRSSAFNAELEKAGAWVFGAGLQSRVVGDRRAGPHGRRLDDRRPLRRVQGADRRVLGARGAGPRRRARLAKRGASAACGGAVEVRPFQAE